MCPLNLGATKSSFDFLLQIHLFSLVPRLAPSSYLPTSSGETRETGGKQVAAAAAAAKSLQSRPTLCDPVDGSPPGSPSLGFSRQERWSGLPFPSPMHESDE